MSNDTSHPARSPDFLSRLHDGELTAAERARFESHRAHCAECRNAAAQFEEALSLYRASSTSPASQDLAARILRKLEAASPRRPARFGVVFGIDMKWAGAFAAALIAVIIGSSVLVQREAEQKAAAPATPISVFLPESERQAAAAKPETAAPAGKPAERKPPEQKAAVRKDAPAPLRDAVSVSEQPAAASGTERGNAAVPPMRDSGSAEARAERPSAPGASAALRAQASGVIRNKSEEVAGGEGAAGAVTAPEDASSPRLLVYPADGGGSAPAIATPGAAQLLAAERGREYFLLVEAGGKVRDARPTGAKKGFVPEPEPAAREREVKAPAAVWNLRFAPGDRTRRLLLRIE